MADFHAYELTITVPLAVPAGPNGSAQTLPVDTLPALIAATMKQALAATAPAVRTPVVVLGTATPVTLP